MNFHLLSLFVEPKNDVRIMAGIETNKCRYGKAQKAFVAQQEALYIKHEDSRHHSTRQ